MHMQLIKVTYSNLSDIANHTANSLHRLCNVSQDYAVTENEWKLSL